MQFPPEQISPAMQACPQVPQLAVSVCRSLQPAAPQQDLLASHTAALPHVHCALEQVSERPLGHCVPQPPQWARSRVVSTQVPLQHTCGALQLMVPQLPMPPSGRWELFSLLLVLSLQAATRIASAQANRRGVSMKPFRFPGPSLLEGLPSVNRRCALCHLAATSGASDPLTTENTENTEASSACGSGRLASTWAPSFLCALCVLCG